ARRLLDGVLGAVAAVALAAVVIWIVDPSTAVQAASVDYPSRFQGFEQNPNTAAMLLALGMPIALGRAFVTKSIRLRYAFILLSVAFAAEIVASGSRGGLIAGFLCCFVVVCLIDEPFRRRAAAAALVVAALALAAGITAIPKPLPAAPVTQAAPQTRSGHAIDAEKVAPLESDIGGPGLGRPRTTLHRSLFSSGPRAHAW